MGLNTVWMGRTPGGIKRSVCAAIFASCLLVVGMPSHAGLQEGLNAYRSKNYNVALKELTPPAEGGNATAQFTLGVLYDAGLGVPRDFEKAVNWYRKAAKQGSVEAQHNLGVMYDLGKGVPQSYSMAAEWYRQAANQGFVESQNSLGMMYELGQGVPQDYKQAVEWYRKAAARGNTESQHSLGMMYELGQGVPQDYKAAAEWYAKAGDKKNLAAVQAKAAGKPADTARVGAARGAASDEKLASADIPAKKEPPVAKAPPQPAQADAQAAQQTGNAAAIVLSTPTPQSGEVAPAPVAEAPTSSAVEPGPAAPAESTETQIPVSAPAAAEPPNTTQTSAAAPANVEQAQPGSSGVAVQPQTSPPLSRLWKNMRLSEWGDATVTGQQLPAELYRKAALLGNAEAQQWLEKHR